MDIVICYSSFGPTEGFDITFGEWFDGSICYQAESDLTEESRFYYNAPGQERYTRIDWPKSVQSLVDSDRYTVFSHYLPARTRALGRLDEGSDGSQLASARIQNHQVLATGSNQDHSIAYHGSLADPVKPGRSGYWVALIVGSFEHVRNGLGM